MMPETQTKPELQRATRKRVDNKYESCESCQFWVDQAYCQRFPPVVFSHEGEIVARWPGVGPNNWCGEYKP